ncbi:hypothetical protein TI05_12780 [Achromatium sp. WMS3]|nr:hypothetical protein TI05_12780 [Achromatium sp. WMS3]
MIFLSCILLFINIKAWGETTVFRYTDSQGRTIFTDRKMIGPQYKLIWSAGLKRLDAAFERTPHLPLASVLKQTPTQKRIYKRRLRRRKTKYNTLIAKVARRVNINPNLLHAVIQAESAYKPNAISPAGAMGLMQLMPATAKRYGVKNILDPEQNVTGGAEYLRDLLKLFNNNMRLALAAYNAGEGTVLRYGRKIPPYRETREYVRRVLANLKRLQG